MKNAHWLSALLVILCASAEIRAQGVISVGGWGLGSPVWANAWGIYPKSHHSHSWIFSGSSGLGGTFANPYCSLPTSRLTFYYLSPPVVVRASPLVLVRARQPAAEEEETPNLLPAFRRRPAEEPPTLPQGLGDGAQASVFRPIRPEDRRRALQPGAPPVPKPPAPLEARKERIPALPKNRAPNREMPAPAPPAADAKTEAARLITLGKQAFASREYARAERRFQEAVDALPHEALAHFLLAQARHALGKYQEAVIAIEAGLRLQPDWPMAHFPPREFYGLNEADYADHLKRLADALAKYPTDAFLLFLYAYQLWFDGRQWEARLLFQRARSLAPDPRPSDRFLQARPTVPILIW